MLLIKVSISPLENVNVRIMQKRVSFLVDVSVKAAKIKSPVVGLVEKRY